MSQPVFVTPYIEAAWKAARAKYPEQHGTWIDLSARLAGRISIVPLMMNVQRLGDLDLLLRAMEDEASANSSSLRGMSMAFHYQLMLSETWVVVCYEALRVVRDRERKAAALELAKDPAFLQDDISSLASFKAIFHDVELLRMPITKYEIAKDSKMKGALNLRAIPANGDATDDRVYEKSDPARSHIMPTGISARASVMWQVLDHVAFKEHWVERRDLADRLLTLTDEVEPAGLREARLAADKSEVNASSANGAIDSLPDEPSGTA